MLLDLGLKLRPEVLLALQFRVDHLILKVFYKTGALPGNIWAWIHQNTDKPEEQRFLPLHKLLL